jgi:hypothetical protein
MPDTALNPVATSCVHARNADSRPLTKNNLPSSLALPRKQVSTAITTHCFVTSVARSAPEEEPLQMEWLVQIP